MIRKGFIFLSSLYAYLVDTAKPHGVSLFTSLVKGFYGLLLS